MSNDINNQTIKNTIVVPEPLGRASVGTWQEDFPLTGRDYEHIKNGKPITLNWANAIFLTTIGFGMNMLGKGVSHLAGIQQSIYFGEWVALAIGFIAAVLLYIIGLFLPNDRKNIMKKLQSHFDASPKKRQVFREKQQ